MQSVECALSTARSLGICIRHDVLQHPLLHFPTLFSPLHHFYALSGSIEWHGVGVNSDDAIKTEVNVSRRCVSQWAPLVVLRLLSFKRNNPPEEVSLTVESPMTLGSVVNTHTDRFLPPRKKRALSFSRAFSSLLLFLIFQCNILLVALYMNMGVALKYLYSTFMLWDVCYVILFDEKDRNASKNHISPLPSLSACSHSHTNHFMWTIPSFWNGRRGILEGGRKSDALYVAGHSADQWGCIL